MKIVTNHVFPDEPCYGLSEMPRMVAQPSGAHEWRWVQAVYVVRDGGNAIAEWTHDYGPADLFERIQPIAIPSMGDDTVAQLQELAEKNRHDDYWARRADEMLAESTLIRDHVNQFDRRFQVIRNRSVFGPQITVQRNDYSQQETQRRLKELINGHG